MKYFPYCTVALLTVALISFVSPAYFIFAKISPVSNFRMYIILITCIVQESVACIYCQHLTDESVKLFGYAQNCHWVNWEKRNKNALLILLIHSMEPLQTSQYGVPSGNYELILKIWRTGYATLTLFMNASGNIMKI
ncbi:unnamed protein product [Psylliodes chrysocephalus]|uniref:Uncharacterized protein n=1 Tax=Psylliodes chrysocephalus TaxID=3402493 RepID=A0A9P0D2L0_9CUCU|nr:unnamed protein product [Psylliodes chrysocephala]